MNSYDFMSGKCRTTERGLVATAVSLAAASQQVIGTQHPCIRIAAESRETHLIESTKHTIR